MNPNHHLKNQTVVKDNIDRRRATVGVEEAAEKRHDMEMTIIVINLLTTCRIIEMIGIVAVPEMREIGEEEIGTWREEVEIWILIGFVHDSFFDIDLKISLEKNTNKLSVL